jgi:hypothetical protein
MLAQVERKYPEIRIKSQFQTSNPRAIWIFDFVPFGFSLELFTPATDGCSIVFWNLLESIH